MAARRAVVCVCSVVAVRTKRVVGEWWWVVVRLCACDDDQTAQRRSRLVVPMVRAMCNAINRHVVERIAKFMVATPPWL